MPGFAFGIADSGNRPSIWRFFGQTCCCSCVADLNHNGVAETIRLEGGYGPFGRYLAIIEGGSEIMRFDLSAMKPWKVQTADIDGDGEWELSIGVYTYSSYRSGNE